MLLNKSTHPLKKKKRGTQKQKMDSKKNQMSKLNLAVINRTINLSQSVCSRPFHIQSTE